MNARSILLAGIAVVRFVVDLFAVVIALGFLAMFALEFFHAPRIESSYVMVHAHRFGDPAVRWVSHWFGWQWPTEGRNYAPLIIAIAIFFVKSILDEGLTKIEFLIGRAVKSTKAPGASAHGGKSAPTKLAAETEKDREVLLKRFREIEATLKGAARKQCTFLSIDVVGSTKMKIGERASTIAATFQAYEELVRKQFTSHGVWKQTWTPDGVMACFLDANLAVGAAQSILSELAEFNAEHNQMREPFHVRAGLNVGEVSIFEDSALEKMADHSIDVAGHMQKYAGEDQLWLSEEVLGTLTNRDGFTAAEKDVDGHAAYSWSPPTSS